MLFPPAVFRFCRGAAAARWVWYRSRRSRPRGPFVLSPARAWLLLARLRCALSVRRGEGVGARPSPVSVVGRVVPAPEGFAPGLIRWCGFVRNGPRAVSRFLYPFNLIYFLLLPL